MIRRSIAESGCSARCRATAARTTATVPSLDASSPTTTSAGAGTWSRMLRTCSPTYASPLCVHRATDTASGEPGDVGAEGMTPA